MLRWMCGVTRRDKIRKANTSEGQREWRRLPKRSRRDDSIGTGMCWGEMKNTYRGKCWERIFQGKGRKDDWKQDGKTRANDTWKILDWERARRRTWQWGEGTVADPEGGGGVVGHPLNKKKAVTSVTVMIDVVVSTYRSVRLPMGMTCLALRNFEISTLSRMRTWTDRRDYEVSPFPWGYVARCFSCDTRARAE